MVVVVSGDTAGWIVPCGCTTNQSGGLPRRATFVHELAREHDVLLLDAGGAPGGTSPYQRVKFEAILAGEAKLDVAAHNVGATEAALGADELRRLATSTPFLSTNLRDADGKSIAETMRIVTRQGRRFAIVGVLSPNVIGPIKQLRSWAFVFCFLCIGLSTRFKDLATFGMKPFWSFTIGVVVNVILGFILSTIVFADYWSKI